MWQPLVIEIDFITFCLPNPKIVCILFYSKVESHSSLLWDLRNKIKNRDFGCCSMDIGTFDSVHIGCNAL
jgi:hypothetical protein